MSLINTSKDILYLVLALSVFGFTFFVCWAIYYLAMILKQALEATKEMRGWVDRVDKIIKSVEGTVNTLKDKVEHSASYLFLIGEGIKKILEIVKSRGENKEETKKKKKEKKNEEA